MKVYIVEKGNQYEGYSIEGVHSSKDLAFENALKINTDEGDVRRVIEWEVDTGNSQNWWID